ncbi:hypothetical protein TNCV_1205701 [Trichonephila clavipes]|nr:hypothetical protein TNCV_1205701 [Trichonephila clavipes]
MSVDHGTSSELQPLHHRRSENIEPLGFSSEVQRCDSSTATNLHCKLDCPSLYGPMPRHTPWRHDPLHCPTE